MSVTGALNSTSHTSRYVRYPCRRIFFPHSSPLPVVRFSEALSRRGLQNHWGWLAPSGEKISPRTNQRFSQNLGVILSWTDQVPSALRTMESYRRLLLTLVTSPVTGRGKGALTSPGESGGHFRPHTPEGVERTLLLLEMARQN